MIFGSSTPQKFLPFKNWIFWRFPLLYPFSPDPELLTECGRLPLPRHITMSLRLWGWGGDGNVRDCVLTLSYWCRIKGSPKRKKRGFIYHLACQPCYGQFPQILGGSEGNALFEQSKYFRESWNVSIRGKFKSHYILQMKNCSPK